MPVYTYNNNYYNNKIWCKNGKCHRDNGLPAIDYLNGRKIWFKNGKYYYPIEYSIKINGLIIYIMKMSNRWWYYYLL